MIDKMRQWVAAFGSPWVTRAWVVFGVLAAPPVLAVSLLVEGFREEWPGFWSDCKRVWKRGEMDDA